MVFSGWSLRPILHLFGLKKMTYQIAFVESLAHLNSTFIKFICYDLWVEELVESV